MASRQASIWNECQIQSLGRMIIQSSPNEGGGGWFDPPKSGKSPKAGKITSTSMKWD